MSKKHNINEVLDMDFEDIYTPVFHNVLGYERGYCNYRNTTTGKYDRKKFADCSPIEEGQFGAVKLLYSKKQTYYSPYTKHLCKDRFLSCSGVTHDYGIAKIAKDLSTYYCPKTETCSPRTFVRCRPLGALGFGPVMLDDGTWGLYSPSQNLLRDERFENDWRAYAFLSSLHEQTQEEQEV